MGLMSFQTTKKVFGGPGGGPSSFSPNKSTSKKIGGSETTKRGGAKGTAKTGGSKVIATYALDVPTNPKAIRLQNKTERTKPQPLTSSSRGFHHHASSSAYSLAAANDDNDGIASRGLSENQLDDLYDYDLCDDLGQYHDYDINHELTSSESSDNNEADDGGDLDYYRNNHMSKRKETKNNKAKAKQHADHVGGNDAQTATTIEDLHTGDPSFATPEITRDLVRKYLSDIWNSQKLENIPLICSPKIRLNSAEGQVEKLGYEGFARMVSAVHAGLADYHCDIHSMVVEGNKAFCRLKWSGRHTGPLMGYKPTGKLVEWMGATEFTCVNGRIFKVWEIGDMKTLEDQLWSPSSEDEQYEDVYLDVVEA